MKVDLKAIFVGIAIFVTFYGVRVTLDSFYFPNYLVFIINALLLFSIPISILIFFPKRLVVKIYLLVCCILGIVLASETDNFSIYWFFEKGKYRKVVSASKLDYQVFPLAEDYGFPSGATFSYLVYDKFDQITLSEKQRNKDWVLAHGQQFLTNKICQVKIRKLGDAFYYVVTGCYGETK